MTSGSSFTPLSSTLWLPSGTPANERRSHASFSSCGGLLRVVEVHAHPDGAVFFEDLAELRRDALRQEHRDARADADELHVLDRAQAAEQVLELLVRQQQRVAPGEQHVADLRVRLDVAQRLLVFGMKVVVLRVRNQPAARAIAAVGRAAVGHEEEHAIRIAVHKARHRRMLVLAERIQHLPSDEITISSARGMTCLRIGQSGSKRSIRLKKYGRDRQGELVLGEEQPAFLRRRERHILLQLRDRRDPVLELPRPVLPISTPGCGARVLGPRTKAARSSL
jgi:hypothetical protein